MQYATFARTAGVVAAAAGAITLGACAGSGHQANSAEQPSTSATSDADTVDTSIVDSTVPVEADASYLQPTFEDTAERDGLVRATVTAVDVATEPYSDVFYDVHFCDATISEVIVGDFTVGDPIRVSCFATAAEGSTLTSEELAAGAYEAIEAPQVGEEIVIAPNVDLNDPTRLTAERLYAAGEDALVFHRVGSDAPDSAQGVSADEPSTPMMTVADFVTLWETTHDQG